MSDAEDPQDVIENATFGGPDLTPPLFDPAVWVHQTLAAILLSVLLAALLLLRRNRLTAHLAGSRALSGDPRICGGTSAPPGRGGDGGGQKH